MSNPSPTPEQLLGVHCLGIHNKFVDLGIKEADAETMLTNLKHAIDAHVREIMNKDVSLAVADEVSRNTNFREFRIRMWPDKHAYLSYKGNKTGMDPDQLIETAKLFLTISGTGLVIADPTELSNAKPAEPAMQDEASGD